MQTYIESLGRKPFNWRMSLISRIRHNSSISRELIRKSDSWTYCPCGNLDNEIPRCCYSYDFGQPQDNLLATYGLEFHSTIKSGNWTKALNILNKIEQRASEILEEMS